MHETTSKAAAFEELVGGSNAAYTVFNGLSVAAARFDEDAAEFRCIATELSERPTDRTAPPPEGTIHVGLITLRGAAEMALQFERQAAETRTLLALLRGDNEDEDGT
jgi:hypothetical protein